MDIHLGEYKNEAIPTWLKYSYKRSCFHFNHNQPTTATEAEAATAAARQQEQTFRWHNQLFGNFKLVCGELL